MHFCLLYRAFLSLVSLIYVLIECMRPNDLDHDLDLLITLCLLIPSLQTSIKLFVIIHKKSCNKVVVVKFVLCCLSLSRSILTPFIVFNYDHEEDWIQQLTLKNRSTKMI